MLEWLFSHRKAGTPNIGEMMNRLGIEPCSDPVFNGRHEIQEALRTCQSCRHVEDCTMWLKSSAPAVESAPAFCPNAVRFQIMRGDHADIVKPGRRSRQFPDDCFTNIGFVWRR